MLWALGQPAALVGLLAGFLLAVVLRAVTQHLILRRTAGRSRLLDLRRDIDVFGVVGAALGGTGWGKKLPGDPPPTSALLAGPAVVLIASQLAFLGYRLAGGDPLALRLYSLSDLLHGVPGDALAQALISFAAALLAFGLFALIPLPPLDGWGLLLHAVKRPGPGFQKARYWLEDQNIGVVILLVGLIIPLAGGQALLLFILNIVSLPILRLWA